MRTPPADLYDLAACRGLSTALFFPAGPGPTVVAPEAVAACRRCTVRAACLALAMSVTKDADHGYWGGTTADDRREMRRQRRRWGAA